ncbi:hypothetical protein HYW55_06565 [Candidatus Gottesmanbacteria bacterium]|nr:hypothetical protein [Candidatus Gottesmanbacteria bacterium]
MYKLLGIVIILIGIIAIYQLANPKPVERGKKWGADSPSQTLQETLPKNMEQTKEEAGVTATVIFIPEKSISSNVFSISLDTHDVNFDAFRFQTGVTLEKNGEILPTTSVSESGSGHHRKAEIFFPKRDLPYSLIISDLAGVNRRTFPFSL